MQQHVLPAGHEAESSHCTGSGAGGVGGSGPGGGGMGGLGVCEGSMVYCVHLCLLSTHLLDGVGRNHGDAAQARVAHVHLHLDKAMIAPSSAPC